MFVIVEIEDEIIIEARHFGRKSEKNAIKMTINSNYQNRVLFGHGFGICLYDVLDCGLANVNTGTGALSYPVKFRFVVFRPFFGEILVGIVRGCSISKGIEIGLGFFNSIFIPPSQLPEKTFFSEEQDTWIWKYADGHELSVTPGKKIRFRVEDILYDVPCIWSPKSSTSDETSNVNDGESEYLNEDKDNNQSPLMTLVGSINDSGLGMVSWWNQEQQQKQET